VPQTPHQEDLGNLREALHRIQTEPEWVMLWEHLLAARQDCLLRLASVGSWEECLLIRGEFNALNIMIEFGDKLMDRLEEAMQGVGDDNAGRRGSYNS